MSKTIVVVPCYNESDRFDTDCFLDFAGTQTDRLVFLLVNDGSSDDTLRVLQRLNDADAEHFSVLDLPENQGKAEAVRLGMLQAIEAGAEHVAYFDADLATPLDSLPRMVHVLAERADIQLVMGCRIPLLGHAIHRKRSRQLLGRIFSRLAALTLGFHVFDTQCGAKMFRVTPELAELFAQPFRSRWIFDVEILARMSCMYGIHTTRNLVFELPLHAWRDVAGSKLKSGDFLKAGMELLEIRATYSSRDNVATRPASTRDGDTLNRVDSADSDDRSSRKAA